MILGGLIGVILFVLALILDSIEFFGLLLLALNAMIPIALTATGEILNERGGLVNVGIEGILIIGAFVSVYAAEMGGSFIIGIVGGVVIGAIVAFLFSLIATYGRGIQLIAGFGINIMALGFVALFLFTIWKTPGFHILGSDQLRIPRLQTSVGSISWIFFATVGIVILAYLTVENTRFGMRLKASGYNPFVTDASGIDVYKIRIVACTIGGALVGFGGCYLSLDYLGVVTRDVAQGRGFIALACLVFSGLDFLLAIEVAFIFGLSEGIALWLHNLPWAKQFVVHGGGYFFLMIPYLAVLVTLIAFPRAERLSKMIGETYRRRE
jgi:simple sugar transport system permease protein